MFKRNRKTSIDKLINTEAMNFWSVVCFTK